MPLSDQAGAWFSEATSSITGNVITKSVEVYARDKAVQQERDDRLVSWLPSWVHVAYLAGLIIGLFSLPVTRGWWRRVWPLRGSVESLAAGKTSCPRRSSPPSRVRSRG